MNQHDYIQATGFGICRITYLSDTLITVVNTKTGQLWQLPRAAMDVFTVLPNHKPQPLKATSIITTRFPFNNVIGPIYHIHLPGLSIPYIASRLSLSGISVVLSLPSGHERYTFLYQPVTLIPTERS